MKIVTIIGTRPQFIKAATVSRKLKDFNDMKEIIVHTGQHYDDNMSDIFFKELEIPQPDYYLGIGSGSHGVQTAHMLEKIEDVLIKEKPDVVLIYGDTNSTLAGALAASKLQIPVAHVEAGLRSFNRKMPEEINRIVADHVSDLLFAPTKVAANNLINEGIAEDRIYYVGDVMFDAAIFYGEKAGQQSKILETLDLKPKEYILSTIHRAYNTDIPERLKTIFNALCKIGKDITIVMPLHPRTKAALLREGLYEKVSEKLKIIEPVGYLDMVKLEKNAKLIITDSGGVQKEAFFYRILCVTLREETEWVELVDLGWNYLVPPDSEKFIEESIRKVLNAPHGLDAEPYGDGKAAEKIVKVLRKYLL
ncbi:non-hydrolyzing UDP-N-acetylglucosamine 2-epimerase [Thermoanaerobacter siderophilus]|uniref:UDP-N-acetylglucosamine 2-epimerase n=1 Tax=Thermoanaerobacter siderophilus SR4 TaxID=880478 RepID=I9KUL3_9THEO|nr:UDP-N-acetylglucosamine 2-epimerase (non-hydrolyzing) [Thermoanaerobacter siderophilus]EIW00669.1 UDP-N-acetylglucosamine 2-epimerase [Thermoanaerobacter siderophilus SR4]